MADIKQKPKVNTSSYLVVYLNKEKTSFQICKPQSGFEGDWAKLAYSIADGLEHTFEVR